MIHLRYQSGEPIHWIPGSETERRKKWEEATGEYAYFEIIRGELLEELFEWLGYAGNVLHSSMIPNEPEDLLRW